MGIFSVFVNCSNHGRSDSVLSDLTEKVEDSITEHGYFHFLNAGQTGQSMNLFA